MGLDVTLLRRAGGRRPFGPRSFARMVLSSDAHRLDDETLGVALVETASMLVERAAADGRDGMGELVMSGLCAAADALRTGVTFDVEAPAPGLGRLVLWNARIEPVGAETRRRLLDLKVGSPARPVLDRVGLNMTLAALPGWLATLRRLDRLAMGLAPPAFVGRMGREIFEVVEGRLGRMPALLAAGLVVETLVRTAAQGAWCTTVRARGVRAETVDLGDWLFDVRVTEADRPAG
jgi:hypothetical protein